MVIWLGLVLRLGGSSAILSMLGCVTWHLFNSKFCGISDLGGVCTPLSASLVSWPLWIHWVNLLPLKVNYSTRWRMSKALTFYSSNVAIGNENITDDDLIVPQARRGKASILVPRTAPTQHPIRGCTSREFLLIRDIFTPVCIGALGVK